MNDVMSDAMKASLVGFLVMCGIGAIVLSIVNHYLNRELKDQT